MDHRNGSEYQSTGVQANEGFEAYVTENRDEFRIPYRMIKRATFTNVSKAELIDIPHAARLQYRLMLLEPVIKASVDFTKSKITVIYNPDTADNNKEKMSLAQLREVLNKEGVSTDSAHTTNEDYDYYKDFYSYAYNSPSIRERIPYGYTQEQWRKLKPEWEEKLKKGNLEKLAKFKAFQEEYLEEKPEIAQKLDPNFKPGTKKVSGRKRSGDKGFWFHGI